jgi:DNA-binding transcriptional ArsR family regulator
MAQLTATSAPLVARRFAALGEPTRLLLLAALHERDEAAVGDLVESVGTSYANVSRHLSLLHREGMVERRREGARTIYRIADPTLIEICDQVCSAIETQLAEVASGLRGGAKT